MSNTSAAFIPSFDNLANASNVFAKLDSLSSERQGWEQNEHKTSTTRLYNLLAEIYKVYETKFVNAKDDDRRTLRQQLIGKLIAVNIHARKSADTLGLLIRYVFQADRRRVMAYKYAILATKSHDKSPAELPEFIREAGGLDELVRKVSFSDETLERREKVVEAINRVQEEISNCVEAPISTVTLPNKNLKDRVMLLAEPCGNGEFKILYVFENPSDGVQKTLIRKAAAGKADVALENSANDAEVSDFNKRPQITTINKITKPEALVAA
jgi:hypothetical protein